MYCQNDLVTIFKKFTYFCRFRMKILSIVHIKKNNVFKTSRYVTFTVRGNVLLPIPNLSQVVAKVYGPLAYAVHGAKVHIMLKTPF